ncbi:MAG: hypothetical protein ACD_50C00153G0016 [uncultured bacterium]|nr:MAG: hypothetical protein ACD_50C00153G0016 [uncultured bacterium]OGH13310.1 MAG: hypothetical protein A2687_04945 [Candidatus Levybacteria bacterium RIFCSPHIGHO2_01_FULL_38_26]
MESNYQYHPPEGVVDKQQAEGGSRKLFSLPHKYLAILVGVLCVVSLGSATLLLSDHFKKDNNIVSLFSQNFLRFPFPTPTPEQILEDDQTIDWNIYSNEQYTYSIKYPRDWEATKSAQEDEKILDYVVFRPLSATKSGELPITLGYTTRTYKEVLDSDPQVGESILVSSYSATRKLKEDSQRNVLISVAFPRDPNTMILLGMEKYKDIYNLMLSTFLFEVR